MGSMPGCDSMHTLMLLALVSGTLGRPGGGTSLTEEMEPLAEESEKTLSTGINNDLTTYIQNTDLLNTNSYQYYLTLPEKLTTYNVTFDIGSSSFNKGTLGNLALIGAAGFLLSFIPKEALSNLLQTDPLAASVRASPVAELGDLGLFRNPYDDTNNPVGGIRDILPRNDDVGDDGTIVATNDYDGDWNRMDSIVGYEVAGEHVDYGHHHHHHYQPDAKIPYQASASTTNHVTEVPQTDPATARKQGQKEKKIGFLKKIEQKVSNFFLKSPVARMSEQIGFATVLNKVTNFWNKNFSWEAGKYSPKNILESKKEDVAEAREYRQLDAPEEKLDTAPTALKVADPSWTDMRDDSKLQVEVAPVDDTAPPSLMRDTMAPPPPPEYHLLR